MRRLPFDTGAVNIVTGASMTGKSSLLSIIDYVLGSDECAVPAGPIRDTVAWYGLRLQLLQGEAFVARRAPSPAKNSSTDCYVEFAAELEPPLASRLSKTTNMDAVQDLLERASGFVENEHQPEEGQTRSPLRATLRHALMFCLQGQNEIANRELLFHKTAVDYRAMALQDTIPYLLGAVDDEFLLKRARLRQLRVDLRKAQRDIEDTQIVRSEQTIRGSMLLAEARDAGLLGDEESNDIPASRLRQLTETTGDFRSLEPRTEETLQGLYEARSALESDLDRVKRELSQTRSLGAEVNDYSDEQREQAGRLQSLGLFEESSVDEGTCVLCKSRLRKPPPSVSELRLALEGVGFRLKSLATGAPHLQALVADLEQKAHGLRDQLEENRRQLESVYASQERLQQLRDMAARRAMVLGRISLYLETLQAEEAVPTAGVDVRAMKERVRSLQEELSSDRQQERLLRALSRISADLTRLARLLDVEHSENPIRLDLARLTVVAETPQRSLPLTQMGSGENFLGYHVAAHLAIHGWLIQNNRPVPRFLFLDQPSQVYFLSQTGKDAPDRLNELKQKEADDLLRLYHLIVETTKGLSPAFQVIIVEHADLGDAVFQSAVKHRWWTRAEKLIPPDWPKLHVS